MASASPSPSAPFTRRKALALMEIVSDSTPTKLFAPAGKCHRISPDAKKYRDLRHKQIGVKRTLVQNSTVSSSDIQGALLDPANLTIVQALVQSAVQDALKKERETMKKEIMASIHSELETGVHVRRLITHWEKSRNGKATLEVLRKAVDRAYAEKRGELPYAHRISRGDLLADIKRLIRMQEVNNTQSETARTLLEIAKQTISKKLLSMEPSSQLRGDELVDLAGAYLHTNQLVHEDWTQEGLQQIIDQAKRDELPLGGRTPKAWIFKMADDIAKAQGWILNT